MRSDERGPASALLSEPTGRRLPRPSLDPEQRVLRQLTEALLFEKLVAYRARARDPREWCDDFDAIYDLRLDFELGHDGFCCLGTIGAFDRVRVAQGSLRWASSDRRLQLIDLVSSMEIPSDARRRLLEELEQTVALSRWNRDHLTHLRAPRRSLSFQQLESAIVEGHPYHPCFKTRSGFSLRDHQQYGFEAGNKFQLQWLAVARVHVRSALPRDEASFWQRELGQGDYGDLSHRLAALGGDWARYALLPVHPWQLRATAPLGLARALAAKEVLALGPAGDRYHAGQSLRTLFNASHPEKANIKLPLNIVCTSAHRNFQGHFVCTAPALSEWLSAIVADDPFLQERQHLLLLEEYAGVLYQSDETNLKGRLGALFRESICAKLHRDEAAAPFTALTIVECDGRPFIADWLAEYGVERWVERLIEVTLIPIWHLLVHHGVAFESHAQNLVLVHRGGWPLKIVLRDFHEDTEFVPDYLRAPERVPAFAQLEPYFQTIPDDDGYRMASTEALRQLFMDCVYVFNLADLSFLLARFCAFPEEAFWQLVRKQLHAYERSGVTTKARIDRLACDSPEIIVESLLRKKVHDGALLDYFEHRVRNTLEAQGFPCST